MCCTWSFPISAPLGDGVTGVDHWGQLGLAFFFFFKVILSANQASWGLEWLQEGSPYEFFPGLQPLKGVESLGRNWEEKIGLIFSPLYPLFTH